MREKLDITLLYVEDDIDIREEMIHLFERHFSCLLVAENGVEALKILQLQTPDIILTDIQMPIMDGIELIKRVKITHADLPVIALTAFNTSDTKIEILKDLGISNCLGKPVDIPAMIQTIKDIVLNEGV